MREVKFRGKRKLNGEWVYGSLIQIGNDWCQIIPTGTEYDEIKNKMYRVISDTVGEYSGLQDKNKKDIYEGDIVNYAVKKKICSDCANKETHSDLTYLSTKFCPNCGKEVTNEDFITTAKVEYRKGGFAYYREPMEGFYQSWPTYIAEVYIAWVEVIGNIYKNPELVNEKQLVNQ